MKRFLFVVPPLTGHVNPTISVARHLQECGHQVAWVAHPRRVRPLLPPGAELIALDDGVSDDVWKPTLDRARSVHGLQSFQFLWEEVLIPLARGMFPGVCEAIEAYRPDVVVVDHQAIGGALAARQKFAKWVTFCTTSASVVDPFEDLPKLKEWVAMQLVGLQTSLGLPVARNVDLSPELVVVFSTEALIRPAKPFPSHYRFVGPSLSDRPDATPFPWEELRHGPRVFVSLGTVSSDHGSDFYQVVVDAFDNEPLQVVLVAPSKAVARVPNNFIVRERVPQLALLSKVNAVVCHAGHNTVCEALAHGLPLVVTPIRDDQPVVANQVVASGAGVRLKFRRLNPVVLRSTVRRVLDETEFRDAAKIIQGSFASAGGAARAARLLEGFG